MCTNRKREETEQNDERREAKMKMLDLFSGLGGASEAMLVNGWEIKRIENNPLLSAVPNTTLLDVLDFEQQLESYICQYGKPEQIKLVWASPPCTEFSTGFNSPRSEAERRGEDYYPNAGVELVKSAKNIIDMLEPQYWVIENVRGSIKYLKPILGEPSMIAGSFVLWGRFPPFAIDNYKHTKTKNDTWSTDPLRSNRKAMIPYEISDALRVAIETQKTLDYWF